MKLNVVKDFADHAHDDTLQCAQLCTLPDPFTHPSESVDNVEIVRSETVNFESATNGGCTYELVQVSFPNK